MKDLEEKAQDESSGLMGLSVRRVNLDEIMNGALPKGSLIMVRWLDASEIRASIVEHESDQGFTCKDWGLYLGISGRTRRMLIVGKDVVEVDNTWGATRIPVELVEEVYLILPREEVSTVIREVKALGRRISLRRHRRKEERVNVRAY
ncbi:MAG: hypothetical protein ABIJ47_07290 [Candidatus Bathyarchaeota archaeon]